MSAKNIHKLYGLLCWSKAVQVITLIQDDSTSHDKCLEQTFCTSHGIGVWPRITGTLEMMLAYRLVSCQS